MASIIDKYIEEINATKQVSIKLKLTADQKTIEDINYILENGKGVLGADTSKFLSKLILDASKKNIEQSATELREKLGNNSESKPSFTPSEE